MNSAKDTAAQVRGGLPHSETPGSPIARISPGLFAACCVLHRLSVPRHPPDALLFARSQDTARGATLRCLILSGRPAAPHPGTRRAQGQAPAAPSNGVYPKARITPSPGHASAASGPAFHEDTSSDGNSTRPPLAPQTHGPLAHGPGTNRGRPASAAIRLGHIHQFVSPRQSTPPPRQHPQAPPQRTRSSPNAIPDHRDQICRLTSALCRLISGGERDRTDDLLLAKQALSQLSYTPIQGSANRGQESEVLIPDA